MRIFALVLAVWGSLTVVTAGVFVALIRGGGGTAAASVEVAAAVRVPEPAAAVLSGQLPAQRLPGEAAPADVTA